MFALCSQLLASNQERWNLNWSINNKSHILAEIKWEKYNLDLWIKDEK